MINMRQCRTGYAEFMMVYMVWGLICVAGRGTMFKALFPVCSGRGGGCLEASFTDLTFPVISLP